MYFKFGKLSHILSIVCGLPDIRLLFVRLQKIFFPILISRCFCWFVYLDVSWDKAKEVNVWNDIKMQPNKRFFISRVDIINRIIVFSSYILFYCIIKTRAIKLFNTCTSRKLLFEHRKKMQLGKGIKRKMYPLHLRIPRKLVFNALRCCKLSF